jgi:hypothetical protein
MDREQFWALIEAAKVATGSDCRAQTAQLVAALRERSVNGCWLGTVSTANSWPSPTGGTCGEPPT